MAEGDEIAEHKISDIYGDSFCLLGLASFCTKFRVVFLPFFKTILYCDQRHFKLLDLQNRKPLYMGEEKSDILLMLL